MHPTKRYRSVATILCAAVPLLLPIAAANADLYGFDKGHTNISFSWNHLGLSRQAGRVMDYDGTLDFDPTAPEKAAIDVTMKITSLWTGIDALDKALKTADYFDAEKYPTMTFKSTAVKATGEKTGEVTGDLTIMGISQPVTLQVTWNFTGEHPLSALNPAYKDKFVSGFSAKTQILRSTWGIKRGTPLTSDEIEITISTELTKK